MGRLRDAEGRPRSPAPAGLSLGGVSQIEVSPKSIAAPIAGSIPRDLADHPDYKILGELGRGGMGVVYLAWNRLMGRKEVLKVVSRELMDRRGVLDRFLREIRSAAQLHHANIVTAYSVIRAGKSIAFAMEYVEGYDLAQLVKGEGPLPVALACKFIYQAALGVQYAHQKGMVHRDIKPSNLIVTREANTPIVKLLDFGLARATFEGSADRSLTHEGQMLGTPDYIAPEQSLDATKADIRADIYSLGCTLYYLLSGGPPFRGSSLYEVLQAHHEFEAKALNRVRPEVPRELAAVVRKMMAKEPAHRFQTPSEVAQALKPFCKPGESGTALAPGELESATPSTLVQDAESPQAVSVRQSLVWIGGPKPKLVHGECATQIRVRPLPPWMWPVLAGLITLGFLITWLPGVVRPKTRGAEVVVENLPDNAVVEVDGQTKNFPPAKGKPLRIAVPSGKHHVVVKRGRDVLLGESLSLEPGQSSNLKLHGIAADDALLVLENLPANAVVELDGEKVQVIPTWRKPSKIATSPGLHSVVVKQGRDLLLNENVTLKPGEPMNLRVAPKAAVTQTPASSVLAGPPPGVVLPPSSVRWRGPEAAGQKAAATPAPRQQPSAELTSRSTGMKFVRIEGGEFMMGSPTSDPDAAEDERPQHEVRIDPFYLAVTEVAQRQYQAVMGDNPSHFASTGGGRAKVAHQSTAEYPVEQVSWFDAIRFCNAISERDGLRAYYHVAGSVVTIHDRQGPGYRLPTEAEWEYACRAGTTTRFSFGDQQSNLGDCAWYWSNSSRMAHPVGLKRANAFGVYDMHGNVWEWCWDEASDTRSPAVTSRGNSNASSRPVRGGGWSSLPRGCRSAIQDRSAPALRLNCLGFRVACGSPAP
jgi:formylglycine-generating enzyme required for sulfatase activity/serine/threonine protein kinase